MRIRKRNNISAPVNVPPFLIPCHLQTHVCHLNQSPWDAISFAPPPSPYQGVGDGVSDCNDCRCSAPESSIREEENQQLESYSKKVPPKLCKKSDGKGWRCRMEAAKGKSYCDYHISQMKSCSNLASKKRRSKKNSAVATTNPYEFYYYSGFGPRWSKERGENSNSNNVDSRKKSNDEIERAVAASKHNSKDEDDKNTSNAGKKRGRKAIKARSLKSLM